MLDVGVIGLGQMGILHAAVANSLPNSKTAAICDKDSRLTKIGSKIIASMKFYDDYSEMLEKEQLRAIFVCTPAQTHLPVLLDIAKKSQSIGLFVEKPLATNYSDSLKLVQTFSNSNYSTMVGFQKRFAGTFRKAKELLVKRALGELLFFKSHHYASENFGAGTNWKFEKGTGGAALEFAPHLIDMVVWLLGEPDSVESVSRSMFSAQVDDYIHAVFQYREGLLGHMDVCWSMRNFRPGEFMIEIHGKNGTLNVNEDRVIVYLDKDIPDVLPAGTHFFPKSLLTPQLPFLLGNPENVLEDQHFLECVETNRPPETNFASASIVNKIIDAIKTAN